MSQAAGPGRSFEELDRFSTEELREQAFDAAEHHGDVGFFWDLLRHLPASEQFAAEDGSPGGMASGIQDVIEVVRSLVAGGFGELEPLFRARFIDYLRNVPDPRVGS
ncbi:MAG TPA: hypothetical protein VFJ21_00800 [Mycobacteriales bacterium]|jgi:hypothetical protein|nr:hypothetical protein [Mycobacteriales bacterium]